MAFRFMKILHITAIARLNGNSGIPAVLKALTDEQNKIDGIESRVLSLCASVESMTSTYFDYLGQKSISDYVKEYMPDLVIIHSFYHGEYARVAHVLKAYKIPFVLEPHGAFGVEAMKKSWLKKYIADRTVFRSLLKNSIAYIYTNEAEMNSSVYEKDRKCVIPNGVYEDAIKDASQKPHATLSKPVFYFLGRYDINHKGIDYLLNALKILDDKKEQVTVRLYGTGTEEQKKFIHEKIKEFKVIDVQDKGTIYGDAKKEALQNVNILLLTSRYEGSPMTILDALSYGNPCLVTPGTNVADELIENNIGWKVELNAESIAEGILRAAKEYVADAGGYYKRSQQHVLDNYIWENIAQQSIEAYKELIG